MLSASNIAAIRTALSAAAVPKADPRKPAARDRKVAQQSLPTPGLAKDAAGGTRPASQPPQISGNAPSATLGKSEIARRRTSERLEDDPAQSDPDRTDDTDFVVNPPTDPDPQKIEVELRRKILDAMKRGDDFGASQAKHFLDGGGKERRFTREEARSLKPISDAEDINKKRFVKSLLDNPVSARPEILDPDGGPGSPGRTGFRDRIMNLTTSIEFDDHWISKFKIATAVARRDSNFILGSGRGHIRSDGDFTAHWRGNAIIVTGVVEHVWEDDYNFDKDALPLGLNRRGWILQQSGRGKVFPFGATWRQRMTVRIEFRDGEPFISETRWEDL